MLNGLIWENKSRHNESTLLNDIKEDLHPFYRCIETHSCKDKTERKINVERLSVLYRKVFGYDEKGHAYVNNAMSEMIELLSNKDNSTGYYLKHSERETDVYWIVRYKDHDRLHFYGMFSSEKEAKREAEQHRNGFYVSGRIKANWAMPNKAYYVYGEKIETDEISLDEMIGIYIDKEKAQAISDFFGGSVIEKRGISEEWVVVNRYTGSTSSSGQMKTELQALCYLYYIANPRKWRLLCDYYSKKQPLL